MSTNRRKSTEQDLVQEVLAKIESYVSKGFPEATRLHEVIMASDPTLVPRLWYGMPGYAKSKDGAVLCFFRKDKHITFGITESIDLVRFTDGDPKLVRTAWFITELDEAAEKAIGETVKRATQE